MKFHIYRDAKGEYRWHLVARNGKVIAASGEGYVKRAHCKAQITKIQAKAQDALVVLDEI